MANERYEGRAAEPHNTDPHVFDTLSGKIIEDLTTLDEAVGRAQEYNDEAYPRCEVCGRVMDDSPAGFTDADWNGETGNHETCEAQSRA